MDSSSTTITTTLSSENLGKKRKSRRNKWEENKRKRDGGRGYVSKVGRETSGKKFRYINNFCNSSCCSEFDREEQKEIFKSFWSLQDKEKQDTFLLGCVHSQNIKYAKSNPKSKSRQYSWKYTLKRNNLDKPVCKQFLTTLLQITEIRMKTVLQHSKKGISIRCK